MGEKIGADPTLSEWCLAEGVGRDLYCIESLKEECVILPHDHSQRDSHKGIWFLTVAHL